MLLPPVTQGDSALMHEDPRTEKEGEEEFRLLKD